MLKVDSVALGTALVDPRTDVSFAHSVQEWKLLVHGVAIAPADVLTGPLDVTLVSHEPDRAEVRRLEGGFTISDMGLRRLTLAAETSRELPLVYLLQRPDRPDDRWFEQGGVVYLRAKVGDRVVVSGHHAGDRPAEVSAMLVVLKEEKDS